MPSWYTYVQLHKSISLKKRRSFSGTPLFRCSKGTECDTISTEIKEVYTVNELFVRKIKIEKEKLPKQSYLNNIESIEKTREILIEKPITLFCGENGSGKSTLLEAIAIAAGFNPEGGSKNYAFSTFDTHSQLSQALTLTRGYRREKHGYFLRAESFYNVATKEIEYSDFQHPSIGLHEQSHGESFLSMMQTYLGDDGLYIFDEPEAALSPQRQLTVLTEIVECASRGAQFIIATHSPILLGMPDAQILHFGQGKIEPCLYEETESYQITEIFINHRKMMLDALSKDNNTEED